MARVIKSPEYNRDAHEIWSFIARDNVRASDSLFRRVEEKALMLAESPGVGRSRDEVAVGLRNLAIRKIVLFYKEVSDGIELVRLLHGSRDISAEFPS